MGKFEIENKRWVFPLCQYYKLVNEISRMNATQPANSTFSLTPVPENVFKVLKNDPSVSTLNHTKAKMLLEALPLTISKKLLPFQREGVLFGLAREGRVLIGDEMGLGKTVQAIAIAAAYLDEWPLLIVCPSSMRCMWAQELVNWLPGELTPQDVNTIFSGRDVVGNQLVTIISYDLFCKFAPEISSMQFKVIIGDESHYLKNPNAKRSKTILPFIRSARRSILLTGTPALSRPVELFNLLNSLHPRLFNNFLEFAYRYCDAHQGPFGLETSGASNLEELHVLLDQHTMVRRLKKDVLTQLPAKRRQKILIKISEAESKRFATEMDKLKELERVTQDEEEDSEARFRAQSRKKALIMKMYVDTGVAKLQAIQEYVADLIECGAKFLVFAHHMEILDGLEDVVSKKKVQYIRIDGSTPSRERQLRVSSFQESSSVRVAILSVTAAGTGLTLTAANLVVFAELHWTPGILLQAEDRAHRIGQQSSVNVMYLVGQGTCDELIWDSISYKVKVIGRALDGMRTSFNA
ncbi:hypothetical protein GUITHDRAFT_76774, partial [Guillardia theta CCMP2712]